jgi:glycosyltransferase involved in cell wall biosynthesis
MTVDEIKRRSFSAEGYAVLLAAEQTDLSQLRDLAEHLSGQCQAVQVVAVDLATQSLLEDNGIDASVIDNGIDLSLYDGLDERCMRGAASWKLVNGEDVTALAGISVGDFLTWEMTYFLAEATRCLINCQSYLNRYSPSVVIDLTGSGEGPLESIVVAPAEDFHGDCFQALGVETIRIGSLGEASQEIKEAGGHLEQLAPLSVGKGKSAFARLMSKGKRTVALVPNFDIGPELTEFLEGDGNITLLRVDVGTIVSCETTAIQRQREIARKITANRLNKSLPRVLDNFEAIHPGLGRTRFLTRRLDLIFKTRLANLYGTFLCAQSLFAAKEVDLVILHNDVMEFSKLAVAAARFCGAKTLVLLHGVPAHPIGFIPLTADRIAVFSDSDVTWFGRHGVPRSSLTVTGPTRWKGAPAVSQELREQARADLGLSPQERVIVIAHQHGNKTNMFANVHWPASAWQDVIKTTLDAAEAMGGATVVVKLHPGTKDEAMIAKWLDKHRSEYSAAKSRLLRQESMSQVLLSADIVIAAWSTTVIEAAMAGIPVLLADFTGRKLQIDYAGAGLGIAVRSRPDLQAMLTKYLTDPEARKEFFSHAQPALHKFESGTNGRAANLVKEMLK